MRQLFRTLKIENGKMIATGLAVMLAVLLSSPATAQQEGLDARDISLAVETELLVDEAVPSHLIDVETTDGIVTLTGSVDNILARDRAERVAETIKGVRGVINKVTVEPVMRTDEKLYEDVHNALMYDPATEGFEIEVDVDNGLVRLDGEVESWQEKQLASTVAKGVIGVREVENRITIDYPEERSDYEIKQDVKRRLDTDVWVDEADIEVSVDDGNVNLDGIVGSAAEKRWARYDAWVYGAESVDVDNLDVEWFAKDAMKRKQNYEDVSDQDIKQAIKDALYYDPRVYSFNLEVTVDEGAATLAGEVDNLKAKTAAAEDASNVLGVWRVNNHIKVRPEVELTNAKLEKKVNDAILRDPYLQLYEVEVDARNGMVYLNGKVNSLFEKQHAEDVAERVKGVVDVVNYVDYQGDWERKSDWALRQDVWHHLYWSPFVEETEVEIKVDNGVVTLEGEVDTWIERMSAEENAYEAGAKNVLNDLGVASLNPFSFMPQY
ncbi:MAG: BON domain-containing protein [candidate division Zixibacteria bacterium]|nr:BON domain-containing protein [candidate division Zixibacteria bacterium]